VLNYAGCCGKKAIKRTYICVVEHFPDWQQKSEADVVLLPAPPKIPHAITSAADDASNVSVLCMVDAVPSRRFVLALSVFWFCCFVLIDFVTFFIK